MLYENRKQDIDTQLAGANASANSQQRSVGGPSHDTEPVFEPEPPKVARIAEPSRRKSTGPRTPHGKQKSKYNALKHGLLSKAALLKGESTIEYKALLDGFRQYFDPHGKFEDALVEYLRVLFWKRRRFLEAERAEVSKRNYLTMENLLTVVSQTLDYAQGKEATELNAGNNLSTIRMAINMLDQMRTALTDPSRDKEGRSKFATLFFPPDKDGTVRDRYIRLVYEVSTLAANLWTRMKNQNESLDLGKVELQAIDAEIERLSDLYNMGVIAEGLKTKCDVAAATIPSEKFSGRLLRHDAHTSREIERTLNQLDRLQRTRKGQPVPPTIKVEVS